MRRSLLGWPKHAGRREPPAVSVAAPVRAPQVRGHLATRGGGLVLALGVLGFAVLLSLAVGARSIPFGEVVDALRSGGDSRNAAVVNDVRVPRTLLGIAVGVALGPRRRADAGAHAQPARRPGPARRQRRRVGGRRHRDRLARRDRQRRRTSGSRSSARRSPRSRSTRSARPGAAARRPVRLALAGTAISVALTALIVRDRAHRRAAAAAVQLLVGGGARRARPHASSTRSCRSSSRARSSPSLLARPLNALALGDDSARALGARVGRTRIGGAVAITLLCGAATAAAGPIYFLGLTVPHAARAICGPDQRWVLAYSAVLGAALLLVADVIGRVARAPGRARGRAHARRRRRPGVHRARAPEADRGALMAVAERTSPAVPVPAASLRVGGACRCACAGGRSPWPARCVLVCLALLVVAVGTGEFPIAPGRRARRAGRRRRRRHAVHRARAAAAARAVRGARGRSRSASPARCSRRSRATRSARRTSSASSRARRSARWSSSPCSPGSGAAVVRRRAGRRRADRAARLPARVQARRHVGLPARS